MQPSKQTSVISPRGDLNMLSQYEVSLLRDANDNGLHSIFRRCCLAVLNCGNECDEPLALLDEYSDFDVRVLQRHRGVALEVINAPGSAFVDGKMILGVRENLFSVLRDVLYVHGALESHTGLNMNTSEGITNFVFHVLRNANAYTTSKKTDIVVCWGGHSISREEYDYSKEVGYRAGLHKLQICTGCGAGAMKGPMKGAAVGHLKQHFGLGRYIGITEPGIIASESPNPIVNELIIMPDIEKRLEAFVRLGHAFVVFPGGVGTAEEILFLLGVLLNPENSELPFPLVMTGPRSAESYFEQVDRFIVSTLGEKVRKYYRIIIDDPIEVAAQLAKGTREVFDFRREYSDAFYFNWRLNIDEELQKPFIPTHENMATLELNNSMATHQLAYNLRRVFSGIVAGNVKEEGIRQIQKHGPFAINGDAELMKRMDALLEAFAEDGRMKLAGKQYVPCYKLAAA
ncbi:MAG: LOG family protein [Gammaproteobacteria bacterium]|nr:LOG family protein [Gammaproteobacteria bacterium]